MAIANDTLTSSLPWELIELILMILPIKYLIRLTGVSKSWYDLITSPIFIKFYTQLTKNSSSQPLFISKHSTDGVGFLRHFPMLRIGHGIFDTESVLQLGASHLECSCDGLILCRGFHSSQFLLWNPWLGTHTRVYYTFIDHGACGLCRDPTTNNVKIVILAENFYRVYSNNADSWITREFNNMINGFFISRPEVSLNGAVYWVLFRRDCSDVQDIVYFDSSDDEVRTMEKPVGLNNNDRISLVGFKDRLCAWFNNAVRLAVQIWRRDQNSWTELMRIPDVPTPFDLFRPVWFGDGKILINVGDTTFVFANNNRRVVFRFNAGTRHLVYHVREKVFEQIQNDMTKEVYGVLPYTKTIVMPHRRHVW